VQLKEELLRFEMSIRNPGSDRVSCLFGDFELHRSLGLRLHDNRARRDSTALHDIIDTKSQPDRTRAICCRWRD
jgi:hypothetical protein